MKIFIKNFLFLSFTIFFFFLVGCSPSTTITKIYLQDIKISGPINQTPIHLTDSSDSKITISPLISFGNKKSLRGKIDGHTKVNANGFFQIDTVFNDDDTFYFQESAGANSYQFTGNNLTWNIAEVFTAVDIDFQISKHFALFGGVNYSLADQKGLWGGLFGLGLLSTGKNSGIRVDIGLNIQEIPYEAYTIATVDYTSSSSSFNYVVDYYDVWKKTHFNPFITLTANTTNPDWIFNIFAQAGYNSQGLIDFSPETQIYHNAFYTPNVYITEDLRGEATAGVINFTPGLFYNVGTTGRVVLGARLFWITQLENIDNSFYWMPVVQFNFTL